MSKFSEKILSTFGFEVVYPESGGEEDKAESVATAPPPPASQPIAESAEAEEKSAHVVLFEPNRIGDAKAICDELKLNRTVVINVEKLEFEDCQRLFDFITGASYVLRGTVQEIDRYVYVIAPHNVYVRKTDSQAASTVYDENFEDEFEYEDEEDVY
ncbi:MAG: cell division protein SepF [Eubacteriaceae bacterium]|nr:cell division protein SepF [Eubacteriaceae bacterium]